MGKARWVRWFTLSMAAGLLGACSYPGMVRLSSDTYRLSRADAGHVYADTAAMRAAVMEQANVFARSKGMTAVEVAVREDTLQVGHLSTIDYDFRLVQSGTQPALVAPVLAPASTAVAPAPVATPAAAVVMPAPPVSAAKARPDYYDELIRLDDLRKRGILTEDEFQTLKAKIISGR
ncbi:MAG: SHOCT domain-containing protein [Pseudomonadota bacterium]